MTAPARITRREGRRPKRDTLQSSSSPCTGTRSQYLRGSRWTGVIPAPRELVDRVDDGADVDRMRLQPLSFRRGEQARALGAVRASTDPGLRCFEMTRLPMGQRAASWEKADRAPGRSWSSTTFTNQETFSARNERIETARRRQRSKLVRSGCERARAPAQRRTC